MDFSPSLNLTEHSGEQRMRLFLSESPVSAQRECSRNVCGGSKDENEGLCANTQRVRWRQNGQGEEAVSCRSGWTVWRWLLAEVGERGEGGETWAQWRGQQAGLAVDGIWRLLCSTPEEGVA